MRPYFRWLRDVAYDRNEQPLRAARNIIRPLLRGCAVYANVVSPRIGGTKMTFHASRFAALILFFAPHIALAADFDADECSGLLTQGIMNTLAITSSTGRRDTSLHQMCEDIATSKAQAKGQEVGGSYGPFSAKYSVNSNFAESFDRHYCENNSSDKIDDSFLNVVQNQVDPTIVQSYVECKQNVKGGLRHRVRRLNDETELDIDVWGCLHRPLYPEDTHPENRDVPARREVHWYTSRLIIQT